MLLLQTIFAYTVLTLGQVISLPLVVYNAPTGYTVHATAVQGGLAPAGHLQPAGFATPVPVYIQDTPGDVTLQGSDLAIQ